MTGPIEKQKSAIEEAATIIAFVAISWLADIAEAYAAGARWFTLHFVLPSLGLFIAAGFLAFAVMFRFRRRVTFTFAVLALGGAFLLWTYRLAGWPTNIPRWILESAAIFIAPLFLAFLPARVTLAGSPLLIVAYHIAKTVERNTAVATLRRELPAIGVAILFCICIALAISRFKRTPRPVHAAAACGAAMMAAIVGVGLLIHWIGDSFPIVTNTSAPHGRPKANEPNIILIVIDTLRADRLGIYGYQLRPTSPFIDRLAAEGEVYQNAYATSSWTVPSVATMFSGLPPEQHGVVFYGASLPNSQPTLAERLRARGYATTAVVANYLIDADHGFARGFDRFSLLTRFNSQTGEPSPIWIDALLVGHFWCPWLVPGGTPKPEARSVVHETLRAIETAPKNRPLFVYMHLLDPHHPCDAPPSSITRDWRPTGSDLAFDATWSVEYDREIRYADYQLSRFVTQARTSLGPNTIYIVVADHGEELGERGKRGHGVNLDDAVIRVPLIVAGRRKGESRTPFSLTHLADLIDSAAESTATEPVRAHLIPPHAPDISMSAVQLDHWKLLTIDTHAGRREQLFHLPDEERNVLRGMPQVTRELQALRDAIPHPVVTAPLNPEDRAKMHALGYIH